MAGILAARNLFMAGLSMAGKPTDGNGRVSALRLVARSRWVVHQGHLHLTPPRTTAQAPACVDPSRHPTPRCPPRRSLVLVMAIGYAS